MSKTYKFIYSAILAFTSLFFIASGVQAQTTDIFPIGPSTADVNPGNVTDWVQNIINALPTIIFVVAFIAVFAFMFFILIKSLNPFTDDQEGKFKEGKTWFTRAGILIIAPIIVFIVVVIVYTAVGFGNPFVEVRNGLTTLDQLLPTWTY